VSRYIYTAKLVPIGKPVNIPDQETRQPCISTFDDKSFEIERTSKSKPEVWVDHDRNLRVGKVGALYVQRGWHWCDFQLDRDVPDDIEFEVGQPVSVGLSQLKIGSRGTFLMEVSIVRRGAVQGAEITSRWQIPETPPPPATKRTEPKRTKPVGQVIYGDGTLVRRNMGQVTAVGGRPLRTNRGEPIRYERDNIIVSRSDGTQVIYCGREGRADAIRDGVVTAVR
jgi:hypothetical protein